MIRIVAFSPALALLAVLATGCQTNSNAENGALFGGGTGALLGGIIGHQFHNTAAGAVIGAGAGAVTGAVVGNKIDESEARNRALIEARLGHPVSPGAVSIDDVIAMNKAGVNEDVIVSHVNNNGITRPLNTADITYLTQNGVTPRVIQTMQNPAHQAAPPVVVEGAPPPPPVVVAPAYYYDPYWGPRYYRPYPYYHNPGVVVGVGFH
jgi:outer membrane protein with glycine zipper